MVLPSFFLVLLLVFRVVAFLLVHRIVNLCSCGGLLDNISGLTLLRLLFNFVQVLVIQQKWLGKSLQGCWPRRSTSRIQVAERLVEVLSVARGSRRSAYRFSAVSVRRAAVHRSFHLQSPHRRAIHASLLPTLGAQVFGPKVVRCVLAPAIQLCQFNLQFLILLRRGRMGSLIYPAICSSLGRKTFRNRQGIPSLCKIEIYL